MAFEDVVADVIAYLEPVVAPVPVHAEIPKPRPVEFLQVRRIGGPAEPPVREIVRLHVEAWATSEVRAMEILRAARPAVWDLAAANTLGYMVYTVVEFAGPTQGTDTETGVPVAWFRPELTVRSDDVIHLSVP